METNLTVEAIKFMVLGMGIVITFLTVMIFALKFQSKLIGKYFPEKKVEPVKPKSTVSSNTTNKIAAIVAAVQHHKNLKG